MSHPHKVSSSETSPSPTTNDEECEAETWSWYHFGDQQTDAYWIKCTLVGPHIEHADAHTGLKWYSLPGDEIRRHKK